MRRERAAGFTLIETIAAIVVLAIAFSALLGVTAGALRLIRQSAARNEAALWARSLLDTRFAMAPPRPGHSEGRFDATYRWRLDVTPATPPGAAHSTLALYRIDLDVLWGQGGDTREARFSTLRLASAMPDGVAAP